MICEVGVVFTPAEYRVWQPGDLTGTTCVVFDILRATSTMVTALAAGAAGVLPVGEISEALECRRRQPGVLLAGERGGRRIGAALTGGIEFELGNSPREFTAAQVAGKLIVTTTTNGTRALRACAGAEEIVVSSFLNLTATARHLVNRPRKSICLVCAGTGEETALEDLLAAGALCDALKSTQPGIEFRDSAIIARSTFLQARSNLADAVGQSRNARQLSRLPELNEDVRFCLQRDAFDLVAVSDAEKVVRRLP